MYLACRHLKEIVKIHFSQSLYLYNKKQSKVQSCNSQSCLPKSVTLRKIIFTLALPISHFIEGLALVIHSATAKLRLDRLSFIVTEKRRQVQFLESELPLETQYGNCVRVNAISICSCGF